MAFQCRGLEEKKTRVGIARCLSALEGIERIQRNDKVLVLARPSHPSVAVSYGNG